MQVFLIRHADASDVGSPGLSELGRKQAARLGERLRWHDCAPTALWTSPLPRACETAELVCDFSNYEPVIERIDDLAPGGDPHAIVAALRAVAEADADAAVMIVGHEPGLSAIGAALTGEMSFAQLGRASAARIIDGRLRWRFGWDAEAPTAHR